MPISASKMCGWQCQKLLTDWKELAWSHASMLLLTWALYSQESRFRRVTSLKHDWQWVSRWERLTSDWFELVSKLLPWRGAVRPVKSSWRQKSLCWRKCHVHGNYKEVSAKSFFYSKEFQEETKVNILTGYRHTCPSEYLICIMKWGKYSLLKVCMCVCLTSSLSSTCMYRGRAKPTCASSVIRTRYSELLNLGGLSFLSISRMVKVVMTVADVGVRSSFSSVAYTETERHF